VIAEACYRLYCERICAKRQKQLVGSAGLSEYPNRTIAGSAATGFEVVSLENDLRCGTIVQMKCTDAHLVDDLMEFILGGDIQIRHLGPQ
jgi:hypothetical protein